MINLKRKGSFVGEVIRVRVDYTEQKFMCFPDPKTGHWIRFYKDVNVENYNTWVWTGVTWVTKRRFDLFNKRGKIGLERLQRIEKAKLQTK